jgi:RNA polymerase sigma-70 factor (sigma-E family)
MRVKDAEYAEYVAYVEGRLTWLRRVAFLLCRDEHAADDLTQVTVTKLFAYWPRARRADSLDGYVRTIMVRAFLREKGSGWGRRVVLSSALPDMAARGADWEAALDVRDALLAVPARQRATLVLRFYCDLDVEQAAAALGCSAGTVKSQTSKGLANMRRLLEPSGASRAAGARGAAWARGVTGVTGVGGAAWARGEEL